MASKTTNFVHLRIPLEDVLKATNNFHKDNIIGHGGFGTAYKGKLLRSGKSMKIALRRLDRKHGEGDIEFWTEISVLSDLNHTNIVSIIGFCDEKKEKIIITTYQAKGSLKEYLNDPNLTWTQRLRISVGVARALSYLRYEEGRGYGVILRNINNSSILLDKNWEAKLSGFEFSIKQSDYQMDQVILSEPIHAKGYTDPAILKTGAVTHKSDIYSFGVVLFEMLCGREAYIKNDANRFLSRLAKYRHEDETLEYIVHPDLWNHMSVDSFLVYSKVAYSCLKEEPSQRPGTDYIVAELEKALELQLRRENLEKKLEHLKIRLSDIALATENFSKKYMFAILDKCALYRVELDHFDKENLSSLEVKNNGEHPKKRSTVVLKRYPYRYGVLGEEQFVTEIEMLTSVKHPNIVTLLGFCFERSEMILVTENFSNGYLGFYLSNINKMRHILTWEKRLKICIDVAHALNYLHSEMEDQKTIIHRAIQCYSITLDENMGAKIDNFWCSVFLPPDSVDEALHLNTVSGRKYSQDPEYEMTGKLKRESDVYSFGVLLFEILCGKIADDPIYLEENEKGLAHVVRRCFYNGTLEDMIDPIIKEQSGGSNFLVNRGPNKDSLDTFIKIAYKCVAETQDQRPTMKVVIKELEKSLNFQEEIQHPYMDQKMDQVVDRPQNTLENQGNNLEHLKIRLIDIKLATNNFSEACKIASVDCTLYRAELDYYDKEYPLSLQGKNKHKDPKGHNTVLIKRYPSGHDLYVQKEFFKEIEMLVGIKHPNIVDLLGFCVEGSEMIIVTENISNGLLDRYLGDVNTMRHILTWEKRLKICIDVAQALNYLHCEMEDQKIIVNRNIKSSTIGLDENWGAKIYDFGLSVYLPPNQDGRGRQPIWVGNPYYIDPEYKMTHKLKKESDVYSFGVVLFEILCGRKAFDQIYVKESEKGLAHVARRCFSTGMLEDIIDPILKEETREYNFLLNRGPNKDSLHTFIKIAHQCVAETQDKRPTMAVVVQKLKKALFYQKNNKDNPRISLEDINHATQYFNKENNIGGGGFGSVFRGNLQDGDGFKTIVAKRLDKKSNQGEKEFLTELQILLEYKHENIIGLVGYCNEQDEKIIVYEYACRGSLDRYLNNASLSWIKRLNICIDVASALYFLHGGVGKQAKVIHRDIKTANILLNDDQKAMLADFGLSLISPLIQQTDYIIDHACGTPGYLDPLYHKSGFLTIESDIYSFGVVLFEILCGKSTFVVKKHEGHYLPDFIKKRFEEGKLDEVVFEKIRDEMAPKSLTTFQNIAYHCLHHEREKRPTTKEVLRQLKKALEFQNMASTMDEFARLKISLQDVVKATNNFHDDNIIRHDRFGTLYKGQLLWSGRSMKIAARRFSCKDGERDLEFLAEMSALFDLKHTNVVSIIGFCDEKEEKIIITKYEANESLGEYLTSPNLTWTQRLRICVGLARALSYICYDKGRDYGIIHCNISSDSILLDENMETKLSGFEISVKQSIYDNDRVCLCEHIGTMGFIDPAIEKTGGVTHKSDIYSFGVVLFEVLCGRKAFIENEDERFLAPLAKNHYENKTLHEIIHPDLYLNQMSPQSLLKYSNIAYSCLNEDQALRPYMDYIIDELEKALELQLRVENIGENLKHLMIHLNDIKLATNNFSETYTIASWDHSTWYRAELDRFDKASGKNKGDLPKGNNTVVMKRYPFGHDVYGEDAFFTEIEMLTSVKHPNIVTLLGYCVEGSEMILVIDDISNGYLGHDYLGNINRMRILTWEKRLKICIDVALALNYLHSKMEDQKMIINRDINSRNIALDESFGAKIVDFWFSIFLPPDQEDEALYVNNFLGRRSYIDPEYMETGKLTRKSDVYSFGVVLFEILCDKGLSTVIKQNFCTETVEGMIDPILMEETGENNFVLNRGPNKDSLHTFIHIAQQCLVETQDPRPTMEVVIKELKKALFFQENNKDIPSRIPLEDIKLATQNFNDDNCIGRERFWKVYKGNLQDGDGVNTIVAKRLDCWKAS